MISKDKLQLGIVDKKIGWMYVKKKDRVTHLGFFFVSLFLFL